MVFSSHLRIWNYNNTFSHILWSKKIKSVFYINTDPSWIHDVAREKEAWRQRKESFNSLISWNFRERKKILEREKRVYKEKAEDYQEANSTDPHQQVMLFFFHILCSEISWCFCGWIVDCDGIAWVSRNFLSFWNVFCRKINFMMRQILLCNEKEKDIAK